MRARTTTLTAAIISNPLMRWPIWLGFAAVFFQSGTTFTAWALAPQSFAGGAAWIWVGAFPILLAAFFVVNRRFGCASGSCLPRGARSARLRFPPGH